MSKKPVTRINQSLTFFSKFLRLEANSKFEIRNSCAIVHTALHMQFWLNGDNLRKIYVKRITHRNQLSVLVLRFFFTHLPKYLLSTTSQKEKNIRYDPQFIRNQPLSNVQRAESHFKQINMKKTTRRQRLIVSQSHSVTFVLGAQVMFLQITPVQGGEGRSSTFWVFIHFSYDRQV